MFGTDTNGLVREWNAKTEALTGLVYTPTPLLGFTLPYATLPCPTLPNPTLPCPTLPYPSLPYSTLSCPSLPYPTLPSSKGSGFRVQGSGLRVHPMGFLA